MLRLLSSNCLGSDSGFDLCLEILSLALKRAAKDPIEHLALEGLVLLKDGVLSSDCEGGASLMDMVQSNLRSVYLNFGFEWFTLKFMC